MLFTVVILTVHLEVVTVLEYWTWIHHLCLCVSAGTPPVLRGRRPEACSAHLHLPADT